MSVSAIILTFNESKHIKRCVESLLKCVDHIYVMDSYSTDNTLDILESYKQVTVKKNTFVNYASQFNYALNSFDISSEWVMRIDADEYIDNILAEFLVKDLNELPADVNGISVNRLMTFMGRLLKHGGMSDYWMLRIWRNGKGSCEQRWMDEHIVLSDGNVAKAKGVLIDDNLNTLSWWAHKHVDYSTREAIDILISESSSEKQNVKSNLFGSSPERTRFLKELYNKTPSFTRPFVYFVYRYFFRLGFLDGKQGFLWCIFQGFWYRMMVDAKVYEIESALNDKIDLKQVIKNKYDYEI